MPTVNAVHEYFKNNQQMEVAIHILNGKSEKRKCSYASAQALAIELQQNIVVYNLQNRRIGQFRLDGVLFP